MALQLAQHVMCSQEGLTIYLDAGSGNHAESTAQKRGAVHRRLHAKTQPVHSVRVHGRRQHIRLHAEGVLIITLTLLLQKPTLVLSYCDLLQRTCGLFTPSHATSHKFSGCSSQVD